MNPLIRLETIAARLLLALLLICFGLSPVARGVLPPPDGGYPGQNTAEGEDALLSLTAGTNNTAVGYRALHDSTSALGNTAVGHRALYSNIGAIYPDGSLNTAIGADALYSNTTGFWNTAVGYQALFSNTTAVDNTAVGLLTLYSNITGTDNTAIGFEPLFANTTGSYNTAIGSVALILNTTGTGNTANGSIALNQNTTGSYNTAIGYIALNENTTGDGNTAVGNRALENNTTGGQNIALGFNAGQNLTTGSNNIDIGNLGVAAEASTIRIGTQGTQTNAYIAGIYQVMVPHGLAVHVDSMGHLGTKGSSARFKEAIKPMDKASEAILKLKPVTFHYKKDLDPEAVPQFGLVAEDVAKVNPDLIVRDDKGKIYTVRYDAVNAMLLNEFLKEHKTVQELKKEIAALTATVKEQESQIRKVSTQVQRNALAPQMASNNP
jgi:trimeric autotransporter adhesin